MAIKTNIDIELNTHGAEGKLDNLKNKSKGTGEAMGLLKRAALAIFSAQVIKSVVDTSVQFEKMNASLKTVTGSTDAAKVAFKNIEQFATETPYQLDQVVGAFIKLKALGLDPSNEALRSYGNTASAMGKDINQMIEAVADAATGEFERLKEFGIKSKQNGDNVSFTFRGVTTTVKKSTDEITKYLRNIGDTDFSTGMADQMDTMGGKFSNLQDAVTRLSTALLQDTGLANLLKDVATGATILANALSDTITNFNKLDVLKVARQIDQLVERKKSLQGFADGTADVTDKLKALASGVGLADINNAGRAITELDRQILELRNQIVDAYNDASDSPIIPPAAKKNVEDLTKEIVKDTSIMGLALDKIDQQFADLDDVLSNTFAGLDPVVVTDTTAAFDDMDRALDLVIAQFEQLDQETARGIAGLDDLGKKGDESLKLIENAAGSMASALEDELVSAALSGEFSFKRMADAIIADLVRIAIRASITAPIMGMFGITPSANGNVFSGGSIIPFANGGVVNKPTLFPMANGAGLMGEAGPEAIMPLSRGADGKLGVKSQGGGDSTIIVNNYSTAKVTTQESTGIDGKKMIEMLIEDKMNGMVQSGKMDKLLKPYGINRRGAA